MGYQMRRSAGRSPPRARLPALAVHKLRLQFALRLLLRTLVAEGTSTRARDGTGPTDRERGDSARCG